MVNENKIKCPKCGNEIELNDSEYALILKQVRDESFDREVNEKVALAVKVAKMDVEKIKDEEISELKNKLSLSEKDKELAVQSSISEKDKIILNKDMEINELKNEIKMTEQELKNKYEYIIERKEDEISQLKDFKSKQSTKMLGENLEQHCQSSFELVRAIGFEGAYFAKDNDASSGSKGDYIFRDFDDDDNEYISIMFEMKNEDSKTKTKHKNEDFFKELDKDRKEKNCEYAVLVSVLEADNETYNNGIYAVHGYEKMYVIRPQFFISLIAILRNCAKSTIEYRKALKMEREKNVDLDRFETNLDNFKEGILKEYTKAKSSYSETIKRIDAAIESLNKAKQNLENSEKSLLSLTQNIEKFNIDKATVGAKSIKKYLKSVSQK